MYRNLVFIPFFVLFSFGNAFCQEWFPVGAQWHYSQITFFPSYGETYTSTEVTGQLEINGKLCSVIPNPCACSEFSGENYVYEEDDKVYLFIEEEEQFMLLYDFTLQPGDTMEYHTELTGDSYFRIDSVTQIDVNGTVIRVQHLSWLEGWGVIGSQIYEFIGSSACLFLQTGFCDPLTGGLRCYESIDMGFHNFFPAIDCDAVISSTKELQSGLKVYPNPATSTLWAASKEIIREIEIISPDDGASISKYECQSLTCEMNISHLNPGLYLIKIKLWDGSSYFEKIMVPQ